MLTVAKICTDSCKQYCNRIYTVPCKRVAKVKNSSVQKFVSKSVKRVKDGTTATTTQKCNRIRLAKH